MDEKVKFPSLNAAVLTYEEIQELAVARDNELFQIENSTLSKRQNVLISGSRGMGKTFLIYYSYHQLIAHADDTYLSVLNIAGLAQYSPLDSASAFTRAVLLQLCREVWTKVKKRPYSELRETLKEGPHDIVLRDGPSKVVARIYRYLMQIERSQQVERASSLGFSAGAKGDKKARSLTTAKQSDILPFEFFEFLNEIKTEVLEPMGKKKFVFLVDEGNYLPAYDQSEILHRYLDVFTANNVQFVFSISEDVEPHASEFVLGFDNKIRLAGLQVEHTEELLEKYKIHSSMILPDELPELLYAEFSGHPRATIAASSRAQEASHSEGSFNVSMTHALNAIREVRLMLDNERQMLARSRSNA